MRRVLVIGWLLVAATGTAWARQSTNPLAIPDPPPLPGPGLVTRFVFEQPWPLAGACVIGGVSGFLALNRAGRARAGALLLGACSLAAMALVVAAATVETGAERLRARGAALVHAVARADAQAVDAALAPDATLRAWLYPGPIDKRRIVDEVRSLFGPGAYRLKEHAIVRIEACVDGPNVGRVQVKVRAVPASQEFPHLSWWRLDYRRGEGGEWRVSGIEPLYVAFVSDPRGGS